MTMTMTRRSLMLQSLGAAGALALVPSWGAAKSHYVDVIALLDGTLPLNPTQLSSPDMPVIVHLVRYRGELILVGAGLGSHPGLPTGRLLDVLASQGVSPGEIDRILITHHHAEQIGGLITSDGSPVFPRAEIVSCRTEWRWWNERDAQGLPVALRKHIELSQRAMRSYASRTRFFSGTEEVAPGITGFPALGPTAGHSLYRLESAKGDVLVLGALVQAPDQLTNLTVDYGRTTSPETTAATRMRILSLAADERLTVIGSHMPDTPAFVQRSGAGFVLTSK